MARKCSILLPILFLGVALDLITKLLVMKSLPMGKQIVVIPGFFNLVHIHNKGVAFGLLAHWSTDFARLVFVASTTLVLAVVTYLWWRSPDRHWRLALGYSLIITGALGNLIDRVRLGEVVDFLDFYWNRYHWPAFNVADSLVCLGAGVLIWVVFRDSRGCDVSGTT
jgi:signal peptidase II